MTEPRLPPDSAPPLGPRSKDSPATAPALGLERFAKPTCCTELPLFAEPLGQSSGAAPGRRGGQRWRGRIPEVRPRGQFPRRRRSSTLRPRYGLTRQAWPLRLLPEFLAEFHCRFAAEQCILRLSQSRQACQERSL